MSANPDQILTGDSREAWGQWRRKMRSAGLSPNSIRNYGVGVAALQIWLNAERGGLAVIDAETADVEDYLAHVLNKPSRRGEPTSPGTAASHYRWLRQWWRFLAAEMDGADVMASVKGASPRPHIPAVLSDSELRALLGTCKPKGGKPSATELRDEAIIRVFLEPGSPRCSEMAALTLDDLNLDAETATIRHGKGNRLRVIPLSPDTQAAIFRYKRAAARRASSAPEAWLSFGGRAAGKPLTPSGILQMLERRSASAGLPKVHPHQLRHTAFADFDNASGGNINAEMGLFGWTSPQMAHHYGRDARERQALALAKAMNRGGRF